MHDYGLAHLSDTVLLRDLAALVDRDRVTTATLLAHIAEVDARRLYVPAGYASMHAYCVEELRLSEDAAYRRIQAARAARQFPSLFAALAIGRVHLSAVCLLSPHLTPENMEELIEAATHRRKSEIEQWLARSFPMRGAPGTVRAVQALEAASELVPGRVGSSLPFAPNRDGAREARAEEAPFASERYLLQATIDKATEEKLRYAQALLSHAVPTGDVAQVLNRALDALIAQLEKRKFGTGSGRELGTTSLRPRRSEGRDRHVPASVRRAVWVRDQGRCTFIGAKGHRCGTRHFLEFDHVDPVARGGRATVEGMRLRCRAHNQYEAERAFGAGFMGLKRHEARVKSAQARARTALDPDVMAALRSLGCRADLARRAAEFSQTHHGATLEERTRAALQFLGRRSIQPCSLQREREQQSP